MFRIIDESSLLDYIFADKLKELRYELQDKSSK